MDKKTILTMEKKRIGYLDAMRGFTMILVVYSHVISYAFHSVTGFSFNDIFVTFRMPLFFFLSGFLMYKPARFKEGTAVLSFLKNKFMVQLIPTLVFSVIYCLIFRYSFGALWFEKAKCGYWFTITLFYFFTIYAIGDLLLGKFLSGKKKLLAGSSAALLVYAFSKYSLSADCPWADSFLCGFVGYANLQFFLFFFFGAILRSHFDGFQRLLDKKESMLGFLVCFFVLQFALQLPKRKDWIISCVSNSAYSLIKAVSGFFRIITVFDFFRKYHAFFETSSLGSGLQYIGARTLDIYLIHLLLIQTDFTFIGEFLGKYSNPILELLLGATVSLLIIGICLVISNILRCSDVLAKLLFGKVIKTTNS